MDLLDQIRAAREIERVALLPQPGFTDATGLGASIGTESLIAAAAIEDEIASMIREASDVEFLAAYEQIKVEPGDPEAIALLAEAERRHLDI